MVDPYSLIFKLFFDLFSLLYSLDVNRLLVDGPLSSAQS